MSAAENVVNVCSTTGFQDLLSEDLGRTSLIYFWTAWAAPCGEMDGVVEKLAKAHPGLLVLRVEAEKLEEISESFDVDSVPTCVLIRGHALLARIAGLDAGALKEAIERHMGAAGGPCGETEEELGVRMRAAMNQSGVVLFMKGAPDAPQCGFSRSAVALLREKGVGFTHFDILGDERVRQGLKRLNDWPTYPQFVVRGEFVGGLDVVREMVESGEFGEVFGG